MSYNSKKAGELRQLCTQRGIDIRGLTKRSLIAALRDSDQRVNYNDNLSDGSTDNAVVDRAERSDELVAERGPPDDQYGVERSPGGESDSVLTLRLQLELERERAAAREREWAIERERIALQANANPLTASSRPVVRSDVQHMLPKLSENGDILTFFNTLERAMLLNYVDKVDWPRYLPAQLNSKANKVLAGLTLEENKHYETCKQAILKYYQLNADAYLRQFRSLRRSNGDNFRMHRNKLKEYLNYYLEAKNAQDFEAVFDCILDEQFVDSLPNEVKQFVISKQPVNSEQSAEFADLFTEVARNGDKNSTSKNVAPADLGPNSQVNKGPQRYTGFRPENRRGPARCFGCGDPSHRLSLCPQRKLITSAPAGINCRNCGCYHPVHVPCYYPGNVNYVSQRPEFVSNPYIVGVTINNIQCDALRDSGNTNGPVLVDPSLVEQSQYTGKYVFCRGAFDTGKTPRKIPLAVVPIRSAQLGCNESVLVEVGVCGMIGDVACNVGNSLFENYRQFHDILYNKTYDRASHLNSKGSQDVRIGVVNTRSRSRFKYNTETTKDHQTCSETREKSPDLGLLVESKTDGQTDTKTETMTEQKDDSNATTRPTENVRVNVEAAINEKDAMSNGVSDEALNASDNDASQDSYRDCAEAELTATSHSVSDETPPNKQTETINPDQFTDHSVSGTEARSSEVSNRDTDNICPRENSASGDHTFDQHGAARPLVRTHNHQIACQRSNLQLKVTNQCRLTNTQVRHLQNSATLT